MVVMEGAHDKGIREKKYLQEQRGRKGGWVLREGMGLGGELWIEARAAGHADRDSRGWNRDIVRENV